jgi:hypothetical protein
VEVGSKVLTEEVSQKMVLTDCLPAGDSLAFVLFWLGSNSKEENTLTVRKAELTMLLTVLSAEQESVKRLNSRSYFSFFFFFFFFGRTRI